MAAITQARAASGEALERGRGTERPGGGVERVRGAERAGGALERVRAAGGFGGDAKRLGGAVERTGGAGMALLPWTRHMLLVVWDQLRLLVHVIYYTFISVFQMFRFEVHVRITDDPSVTSDPSDPFLFSTLFSEDAASDHTEALLSTLRRDEDTGLFMGHKPPPSSSWSVGDWSFFVSSADVCSEEERSGTSCWSSEEEHSLEFDCDDSKALWESLSRSGDPYDPFCFSACLSTRSSSSKGLWETQSCSSEAEGKEKQNQNESTRQAHSEAFWETESSAPPHCSPGEEESKASWETESKSSDVHNDQESVASWECESEEELQGDAAGAAGVPVGRFWESSSEEEEEPSEEEPSEEEPSEEARGHRELLLSRSDSDSSWSSDSSLDSQTEEQKEQNQLLWDLLSQTHDPFNPLSFCASYRSTQEQQSHTVRSREEQSDSEGELWSGLSKEHDPYHPLNFSVLQTSVRRSERRSERRSGEKPELTQRNIQRHSHPQVLLRPWTPASSVSSSSAVALEGAPQRQKKVRFDPEVKVHVMRSWSFACRAARRGQWEESARDRERFKRRIQDTERTVGPVLRPDHRDRVWRERIRPGLETGTGDRDWRPGLETGT